MNEAPFTLILSEDGTCYNGYNSQGKRVQVTMSAMRNRCTHEALIDMNCAIGELNLVLKTVAFNRLYGYHLAHMLNPDAWGNDIDGVHIS